ncbi:MAG: DNA-processing protein DprA [Thermodesulfobacteriota bacterium]
MAVRGTKAESSLFHWLALALTPGVGARTYRRLLEAFGTPEAVFQASAADLGRVPRLHRTAREALTRFDRGPRVAEELEAIRRKGFHLVTLPDEEYPARLKEIFDPPPVLWVAGDLRPVDLAAVAIVGSRGATDWGRQTSAQLAGELAAAGVTVVSGAALGIDAAAHKGALEAGGRTIGILGCGLDVVYPRPNQDLLRRIPEQGALITEFPLGTEPKPGHFPQRNRIISGLCVGVVVVEAGEKSGALITARTALEQNREVMAVPGRAGALKSRGTNALLKEGATLIESGRDVIELIGRQLGAAAAKPAEAPKPGPVLTEDERMVLEALGEEPVHVDALGRKLGLTPPKLAPILLNMELCGLVRQLPGMRYIRN